MKSYFKALLEHEENHDSLDLLYKFIVIKNSDLSQKYCDGRAHLPSFFLLKKLRDKFTHLVEKDTELELLFANAIKCSKLFYAKTIKIIKSTDKQENLFESLFEQEIHPLGQQLINLLVNIKYRIKCFK